MRIGCLPMGVTHGVAGLEGDNGCTSPPEMSVVDYSCGAGGRRIFRLYENAVGRGALEVLFCISPCIADDCLQITMRGRPA